VTRALLAVCVGCVLAVTSVRANARRVIHIPTMAELCPGNAEWSKVTECIKRHGKLALLRDEANLKLVGVTEGRRINGLYVYSHDKQWRLRGELRADQPHDVLRFERVKLGKHTGHRLDVGFSTATSFSSDGEIVVPALLRQTLTLLCFDDTLGCTQIMTACDLLLHGKAYHSFRGKLEYANRQIKVVGDRRNAGDECQQAELVISD
jgi:hypothetical protein